MKNSNKTMWIVLGVIAIIIIGILAWGIGSYNGLVSSEENVKQYSSNIDADLQRRNDLVPNLVETVKAYASHEEEIFTEIADARSKMMGAGNTADAAQADAQLSSALSRLLMVAEAYPDLKANQNFIDLQTQLEGTENRLKVARTKYNEAAKDYNASLRRFPKSVIAGMFGFEQVTYFEATAGADQVPQVKFD